ncbi:MULTISPECIES: PAS domain-containing protein [Calothrix]|uniref:histidine kinase n=2 Tax=Calothrix TaxID=1186 RepID=A0ABR8AFF0_9CYAN|nr:MULTISPECIES: PAS domain-containing protein [Calothrix]MBD2198225.1 PAS domain-containing protein [Calothrix parietina FACHB-288]MBD2226547.1 PAS domain-containing protein [Calothrix anomala FACHB-343]
MFTPANLWLPAELATAIIRDPLTIAPDATVVDAIALMNAGTTTNNLTTENNTTSNSLLLQAQHSCVLVIEDTKLLGIFTQFDLVRLSSSGQNLAEIAIAEVMSYPVRTLQVTNFTDIFVPLSLFQHYPIRHLPLIDHQGQVVGLLTHDSLRQLLRPFDLLNLLTTADVMDRSVVQAAPTATLAELSELMSDRGVNSVVIVDNSDAKVIPLGIVTERDIVQILGVDQDLTAFTAQNHMGRFVDTVGVESYLGEVWQLMQQQQINQVIVTRDDGELLGIVTQSLILSVFNPMTISALVERLVQERTAKIQEQVAREQLLTQIANKIRASLNLEEVLDTAVTALRDFLQCDRLLVYQFQPDWSGTIVAESVTGNWQALKAATIHDPCFRQEAAELYRNGKTLAIDNIYNYGYADCYLGLLEQFQVKANLVVPILVADKLWGLLVGHQCADYRHWQPGELTLLHEISVQLAIAIQQATAYQQLQVQNAILERIAKAEALTDILHDLLQAIEMQLDNGVCSIMLHDGNSKLNFGISTQLSDSYMQQINGLPIDEGMGCCGTAAFRQETVITSDIASDPLWQNYRDLALAQGLKACWSVPIIGSNGEILGVFGVYYRENRTPNLCECETVTQAANIASIAIERHLATQSLQQLNQELENRVAERTAALQASEERWQLALRGTNDGIWDWDLKNNKIFYSQRWKQMRGFSDDEISDSPDECLSRIHPDDCDRVMAAVEDHFAGRTEFFETEYRTQCQDGSYMWVLDRGQVLRDESGQVIRMTGSETDITQRKLAEAALKESKRRYLTLAAAAPVAIFRFDAPLNCVYVNDRWSQMTGRSKESALGKGWIEALHPEDREQRLAEWMESYIEMTPGNYTIGQGEGRHLRPDGSINWFYVQVAPEVDANGQVIGYIGTLTDITARKLAEQENQQLKERLEFLLSASPAVIFTCKPEGDYGATFISDNLYNVTGYTPAEFLAESSFWIDRVHPDDLPGLLAHSPLLTSGSHIDEYRFRHQQGHYIWLRSELHVVRNQQGTPIEFIGYFADISDAYRQAAQRKIAEQENQQLKERLQFLITSSPAVIYTCKAEGNYSATFISENIYNITGYSQQEFLAESSFWIDHIHPEDRPWVLAKLPEIFVAGHHTHEYRFLHQQGYYIWIGDELRLVRNQEGRPIEFVGYFADISDRKQAELALAESQRFIQQIADASPNMLYLCDLQTQRNIYVNREITSILGYSPEAVQAIGENMFPILLHPDDFNQLPSRLARLHMAADGEIIELEYRMRHADGNWRWLYSRDAVFSRDAEGQVLQIIGTAQDITDRKLAEQENQQLKERLQFLLAVNPAVIFTCTTEENYGTTFISENSVNVTGYTSAEFLSDSSFWIDRVHPGDVSRLLEGMSQLFEQGYHIHEYRFSHKAGYYIWLRNELRLVCDRYGNPVEIVGYAADISDRKQAELALEDSQRFIQQIADASPNMLYLYDLQSQCNVYVNREITSVLGYTPEAVQAMGANFLQDLLHPEDQERLVTQRESIAMAANGEIIEFEYRMRDANGQWRWLYSWDTIFSRDPEGQVQQIIGTAQDITARKLAEQENLLLKERLQFVLSASPAVIFSCKPDRDYGTTFVSDNIYNVTGYTAAEFLTESSFWINHVHPEDLPQLLAKMPELFAQGQLINEYRFLHQAGHYIWMWNEIRLVRDSQGNPIEIVGYAADITERKRLEASQNRLIALLEASTDYILIADVAGNAIWNNSALKRLRGLDDGEITQYKPSDYHPQQGVELLKQQAIPAAITNGSWLGENILLDAQGQEIPVSQLIIAHKCPQGEVEFFSTIMRDIRIQKEYEQGLERTNAELRRATRLKDEFLANMSHELRTPLNAILGMSESLLDMILGYLNHQQQQAIATIERSGQHLLALINDILELSKIEADKLELQIAKVSVAQLCKTSLDIVKQQAFKKQIHLHLSLAKLEKEIAVDERRIQQVLINLLSNAIKFTPSGGRVCLEVTVQNVGETTEENHWIIFSVSDTGIGIAPSDRAKLFQPFVQIDSSLNRKYEGSGLGLVLVKRITEMHGGYISLQSELGQGSCFSIYLPYSACPIQQLSTLNFTPSANIAPNLEAIAPPQVITAPNTQSPLILLAEDNEANINTISSYLEAKGYRIIMARNGQEAIDLVYSQNPDLIIMDIQMPIVDGLQAIEQIRQNQQLATIPIIALTAMVMLGDREKCLAVGASEYLAKPVKLKQLTALIEQFLAN